MVDFHGFSISFGVQIPLDGADGQHHGWRIHTDGKLGPIIFNVIDVGSSVPWLVYPFHASLWGDPNCNLNDTSTADLVQISTISPLRCIRVDISTYLSWPFMVAFHVL